MLFWSALIATAAALSWALVRLWRIAAIGSAYRSKVLCSIVFASGRTIDPQRVEDVSKDSYRLLQLFRSTVDPVARTVTTSLFGLRPRTATFRPGLGATLFLTERRTDVRVLRNAASVSADLKVRTTSSRLQAVVERAFTEPNPRRLRRTRAVVVLQDGEIVAEQYASGFDASIRFAGWSMAKSVLNALVGILVGEG